MDTACALLSVACNVDDELLLKKKNKMHEQQQRRQRRTIDEEEGEARSKDQQQQREEDDVQQLLKTKNTRRKRAAALIRTTTTFEDAMKDIVAFGKSQEGNSQLLFEAVKRYFDVAVRHGDGERLKALQVVNELVMKSKHFRTLMFGPYLRHFVEFCARQQKSPAVQGTARTLLLEWNDKFTTQFGFVINGALTVFPLKAASTPVVGAATTTGDNNPSLRAELNLVIRALQSLDGNRPITVGTVDPLQVCDTIASVNSAIQQINSCLQILLPMFNELLDHSTVEWESSSEEEYDDETMVVARATMHIPDDFAIEVTPTASTLTIHNKDESKPTTTVRNHEHAARLLRSQFKVLKKHYPRIVHWVELFEKTGTAAEQSYQAHITQIRDDVGNACKSCERWFETYS